MPEYLSPGVYIEEIERGSPSPIEGVPTSTAAFLGETERGPTMPRLVTSHNDYKRWFGGMSGNGDRYMPQAVNGFFENGGKRLYVCRIVGQEAATATLMFGQFTLRALGGGRWGNRIWAAIVDGSSTTNEVEPTSFRLKVAYWSMEAEGFEPFDPFLADNGKRTPVPALTEDFDNLSIDERSPNQYRKLIDGFSSLVALDGPASGQPSRGIGAMLTGGADDSGDVGVDDFVGRPVGARTEAQGLAALKLEAYRDAALIHAPHPPKDALAIGRALVEHCEKQRFRFAVIDAERNQGGASLDPRTTIGSSSYAAIYYPWLRVSDPRSGALMLVPPGGHVVGVYARTDIERGVHKAPANKTMRGVVDPEVAIDNGRQEALEAHGVNAIRSFPERGIRIWGARTLSSDSLWKYVSVRRLFIFLEHSIYRGTQWVVFERNDERLWERVKDTIRLFLRDLWRGGALLGSTEREAFFVTCDRTTMTQDDVLNGHLICEIGVAPVRPAEFVVFRVLQHTAEARP